MVIGVAVIFAIAGSTWAAVTVQGGVQIVFTPEERRIIKEYYSKEIIAQAQEQVGKAKGKKGLPPGLAKREKLPPGLQRQLERNGGSSKPSFASFLLTAGWGEDDSLPSLRKQAKGKP